MTFSILAVLIASQFPVVLESEAWALASSLLVTIIVAAGTLLLAGRHAPLPLFALLLVLHTMLPLSRSVAIALGTVVTAAHIATSIAYRINGGLHAYSSQVGCIFDRAKTTVCLKREGRQKNMH